MHAEGLGNPSATLVVYIANRPPLDEFESMSGVRSVKKSEIKQIGELTGNHWRKIFNCFAKLCFEIDNQSESTWQHLRDNQLLTAASEQLLLFTPPELTLVTNANATENTAAETETRKMVKLICGKTYFNQLTRNFNVEWVDDFFAINKEEKLIVCPYFDYCQLSNQKITQLVDLINQLN